jgi:predicted GNAT family N-acyltransferase
MTPSVTPDAVSSRSYVVQLENGDAVTYILRGLKKDEIAAWTEFCASAFADKATNTPPAASYFARHYDNDPDRDASLIRVATTTFHQNNQVIAASCRVFVRRISFGNNGETAIIKAGGIGEVCTAANHRRRGLSAQLLQDAVSQMKIAGITISLLHSAPSYFPVYEKAGYVCTTSRWSDVRIDGKLLEVEERLEDSEPVAVRQARFPEDTDQLMSIHQSYSERRFFGCIIRSKEYWERYVSEELSGSLWVAENLKTDEILGCMSIRPRGDRYQLREFSCKSVESVPAVFRQLLANVLEEELELTEANPSSFRLHLPTAVLQEVQQSGRDDDADYISEVVSDDDHGWMYKTLDDDAVSVSELVMDRPHLIWPTDSF